MRIRILMIVARFLPAIGGVESHVREISKRLQKLNFEVTILTAAHDSRLPLSEVLDGNRIVRIPFHWRKCLPLVWLWIFYVKRKFPGFDIIHIHDVYPPLFWYLPQRFLNIRKRTHMTFHGYEADPVPLVHKVLRRVMRKLVSGVICIGHFIPRIYGTDCDFISIGAVQSKQCDKIDPNGAIYVGRFESDTGLMEYLEAIKILKERKGISLPLTICGGGSLENEVHSFAEQEDIQIEFTGYVENPLAHIRNKRVMLAAGYLSILEGMSCGIPVVGFAESLLRREYLHSVIQAGGVISIQRTAEGVANEINRILTEPNLVSKIEIRSRNFAKKMNWNRLIGIYLKSWAN